MTNRSYKFTIPGKPKVKGRPRFTKGGHAYTPANTAIHEKLIREYYKGPKFEGPISVSCVFTAKRTQVTITQLEEPKNTLRGDTTNYLKAVEDALNGVAYEDDLQIYRIVGKKK